MTYIKIEGKIAPAIQPRQEKSIFSFITIQFVNHFAMFNSENRMVKIW